MDVVLMVIFGFLAGAIAKMLMPGRDPGGILVTILLGVAGSLLGGFIFNSIGLGGGERYAGLIGSVIGAMLLLVLYRMFVGRRRTLT